MFLRILKYFFIIVSLLQAFLYFVRTMVEMSIDVHILIAGINDWLLDYLLYIPSIAYFMPTIILFILILIFKERTLSIVYLLSMCIMLFYNFDFQFEKEINPSIKSQYKILSYDLHKKDDISEQDLKAVLKESKTDFICLQNIPEDIKSDNFLPKDFKKNKNFFFTDKNNIAFYSKYKILKKRKIKLTEQNNAIYTRIALNNNINIIIYTVNLSPITPLNFCEDRDKQFSEIHNLLKNTDNKNYNLINANKYPLPIIIAGNFNLPSSSRFIKMIGNGTLNDDGIFQKGYGYKDSFFEIGNGFSYSFFSYCPITRFNYIFANDRILFTEHKIEWNWLTYSFPTIVDFYIKEVKK